MFARVPSALVEFLRNLGAEHRGCATLRQGSFELDTGCPGEFLPAFVTARREEAAGTRLAVRDDEQNPGLFGELIDESLKLSLKVS
jgi:hypothetical protein